MNVNALIGALLAAVNRFENSLLGLGRESFKIPQPPSLGSSFQFFDSCYAEPLMQHLNLLHCQPAHL